MAGAAVAALIREAQIFDANVVEATGASTMPQARNTAAGIGVEVLLEHATTVKQAPTKVGAVRRTGGPEALLRVTVGVGAQTQIQGTDGICIGMYLQRALEAKRRT